MMKLTDLKKGRRPTKEMANTMYSHQWHITEERDGEASTVHIFGKDENGIKKHWMASNYRPRFTVHIENDAAGGDKIVDALLTWFRRQSYFGNGSDQPTRFGQDDIQYEDDVYQDNTSVNMYGYQGDRTLNVYCFSTASVTQRTCLLRFLNSTRGRSASPVGHYGLFDIQAPEHEVAFLAKCVHQSWLSVSDLSHNGQDCDFFDITANHGLIAEVKAAYCTQMFFDIETFASREGTMDCDPFVAGDVIFMIAAHIVTRHGMNIVHTQTELLYLLPDGDVDLVEVREADEPSYILRRFRNEKDLLMAFAALFDTHNVQFVCGYNSSQFDWPYIWHRTEHLHMQDAFASTLSQLGDDSPAYLTKRVTKTKQTGKREFYVLTCPGVVDLDLLRFVMNFQQNGKYTNHKLDTVLHVELGLHKKDMSYQRLYAAYREKNIAELNLVAQYAIGDTLPLDALAKTLDVLDRMAGVADIAIIPMQEVMYRGITNSCTSKIYHKTRSIGYSLPYKPINTMRQQDSAELGDGMLYGSMMDEEEDEDDRKQSYWIGDHQLYQDDDMRERNPFEGATVLDSEPEFITIPVATLDFEGLYPSLIRTYSICYTSIIEDLDDTDLIAYASKHDGGVEIHIWDVDKVYDQQTGIHFDNMDTLIEGMLRLDPSYLATRDDCIRKIEVAVRLIDAAADTDEHVHEQVLDMLGCESVEPSALTSRKFSYVLYRIMTRCTKMKSEKAKYMVDSASKLRGRILKIRKEWKAKIDQDLSVTPTREITSWFRPLPSASTIPSSRRFEKRTVQRKAGLVCKAAKILPSIQEELYMHRQKYKKLMKTAGKGTREYRVYDAANLAAKLFANSLYGYLATTIIPAVILAELVTMLGRFSLGRARDYCEVTFPEQASTTLRWTKKEEVMFPTIAKENELIWAPARGRLPTVIKGGDSVSGDTPILCRNIDSGKMFYISIEQMAAHDAWRPRKDGKEYAFTPFETWSPNGWVRIHTVIRHMVGKTMHRVTTARGMVDVTEDHSLLLNTGKKIKPVNAQPGIVLLHTPLPHTQSPVNMLDQEAWHLGYFFAGHAAAGHSLPSSTSFIAGKSAENNKAFLKALPRDTWKVETGDAHVLQQFGQYLRRRIFFASTDVDMPMAGELVLIQDASLVDRLKTCIILETWLSTKMAFLRGFCAYELALRPTDFQLATINTPCAVVMPKWHMAVLTHLLDAIHMDWRFEMDGMGQVMLRFPVHSSTRYSVLGNHILSEAPSSSQYVYDLSTLSGTFAVGPGRMHVSNTDSCFVGFDGINLEEAIALAMRCADECTEQVFNRPGGCMRFEYEKTSMPTLLGARKNSDAVQFVKDPLVATEITAKGNFKKKRSYCQFLQTLGWAYLVGENIHPNAKPAPAMIPIEKIGGAFGGVLNMQSTEKMHAAIVDVVRGYLWRLYKGDVGWPELAIGAEYTYRTNPVTAVGQLAARIIARHDEPLRLGQRFQMVYVFPPRNVAQTQTQTITDAMCGEALEHVMASDWAYKPHVGYYLRHMYSPLIRNLRIIDLGVAKTIEDLFHNMEAIFEQKAAQQTSITAHFKRAMALKENDDLLERQAVLFGKKRLKRSTLKIAKQANE